MRYKKLFDSQVNKLVFVSGTFSPATPGFNKRPNPQRKKLVTAYILFSADVRKITMDENPGQKFGEISRIVAERWRAMSDSDKQVYAERAKKLNEEKEREEREGKRMENERMRLAPVPATPAPAPSPVCLLFSLFLGEIFIVNYSYPQGPAPIRARQDSGSGGAGMTAGGQGAAAAGVAPAGLQVRQEPLFHSVPPRPQRLLHSEAYIKYIEVSYSSFYALLQCS